MNIGDRTISPTSPVFVIAEIGVNHDGSERRAMELVDIAAACGADAVKLQLFRADALMHASSAFATYQREQVTDATPADMLRRYELPPDACERIMRRVTERGLAAIATPFSLSDVEIAVDLRLDAIKIASPDVVNYPLLDRCAATGRPILVSTGAATADEIDAAAGRLIRSRAAVALMHCVSAYPTPADDAQLGWIGDLHRFGVPVGYSDHTTYVATGGLAVAAGASVIEKHLTYDRRAAGPDHFASADPESFAAYVKHVRLAETMRGPGGARRVLDVEQDVRRVSRQSLVTARNVPAGHVLTPADLVTQRPGTGIPAQQLDAVVGRRATQPIPAGTMLSWDMLTDAAAA